MALLDRSVFRQALAALITLNANFKTVFDYMPDLDTLSEDTKWPIAIVTSSGTNQLMLSQHTNPSDFQMDVFILVRSNEREIAGSTWDESDAEDKIDELDQIIRQIVRNNVGTVAGVDSMKIDGTSQSETAILGSISYRTESYTVVGHNPAGE